MKIASPIAKRKARIEIIPLIDIMFFLLAAFVLVSLTMVRQLTVEVDLPQGADAAKNSDLEPIALAVDHDGGIWYGLEQVDLPELRQRLEAALADDRSLPVSISGDRAVSHGTMVEVLQYVRGCGAENVGFALQLPEAIQRGEGAPKS